MPIWFNSISKSVSGTRQIGGSPRLLSAGTRDFAAIDDLSLLYRTCHDQLLQDHEVLIRIEKNSFVENVKMVVTTCH